MDSSMTMALARSNNLTLYDGAHLELSMRRKLPLESLVKTPIEVLYSIVDEVPESTMSPSAKRFAKALLAHTYGILAGLQP